MTGFFKTKREELQRMMAVNPIEVRYKREILDECENAIRRTISRLRDDNNVYILNILSYDLGLNCKGEKRNGK